jgi:alkanesulfonate monooxygenase SsuD/methylene tetrahydromethanopterin reductase-like flavin-dependent oxidoreductase (luciferase family)
MAIFSGEVALQFTTHIANHYTVPQWSEIAALACRHKFSQLWVNDNLGHRNIFVILTAIASHVPVKLGTAILVPYFRNPIDAADALAALSEMTAGREISVGIARGDYAQAGHQLEMVKPLAMVRETVECLQRLFKGERVSFGDYPALASYYHLKPAGSVSLGFVPGGAIRFYTGGNGPKIMEIAGRIMEGILIGGFYIPLVRTGKLGGLLDKAEQGRRQAGRQAPLRKVCEINISVSKDAAKARLFPKRYIAHMLVVLDAMGFSDADYSQLGIEPAAVQNVKQAFAEGQTIETVAPMISDAMVDAGFIAGTPAQCRAALEELCARAEEYGFDQICLAKLGPDYPEAIETLAQELLPGIVQT